MKTIISHKNRGTGGNSNYRGNCSPAVISDLINFYNPASIGDYSCGSNTTGDVAKIKKIKYWGYDLNMGFDLIEEEIKEMNHFIFYHPAYWDIVKYSGSQYGKIHKNDLSHIKDYKEFIKILNFTILKQFSSLKIGGRMAILMGDIKKKGVLYSMILDIIKPGKIEQVFIKEQFNCSSSGKIYSGNGKFAEINHEYILILKRENPFIESLKITKNIEFNFLNSKNISWKDLIYSVFENSDEKTLKLNYLYEALKTSYKAKNNKFYKEKIRQTLYRYNNIFRKVENGKFQLYI